MYKVAIKKDQIPDSTFEGEEYVIDFDRDFEGYQIGDLICVTAPFLGVPATLEIAIRKNGEIAFRSWSWNGGGNDYLHTTEVAAGREQNAFQKAFAPTQEQIDTVNGLFSGRIKFDGLKLKPGKTLLDICPIDINREEERVHHKIYLA